MSASAVTDLPPLSRADFQAYNSMATHMDHFHNNFRRTWTQMYNACGEGASQPLSAPRLISLGLSFVSHLEVHHNIEEMHIFPVLATRMDVFKAGSDSGPLDDHKKIHVGMDRLEAYLRQCQSGERSLRREEVKDILDSFSEVLWSHLDDEVRQLGAENMRKYWSKAEMARMPM